MIVRLVSVNSTERSTEVHTGIGVGVGDIGAPCSAHGAGDDGTETVVAKNSHVPVSEPPDSKCEWGRIKPFPLSPGAKSPAGAATPDGESIRLSRKSERGTESAVFPIVA